jgi:hypothetical protein
MERPKYVPPGKRAQAQELKETKELEATEKQGRWCGNFGYCRGRCAFRHPEPRKTIFECRDLRYLPRCDGVVLDGFLVAAEKSGVRFKFYLPVENLPIGDDRQWDDWENVVLQCLYLGGRAQKIDGMKSWPYSVSAFDVDQDSGELRLIRRGWCTHFGSCRNKECTFRHPEPRKTIFECKVSRVQPKWSGRDLNGFIVSGEGCFFYLSFANLPLGVSPATMETYKETEQTLKCLYLGGLQQVCKDTLYNLNTRSWPCLVSALDVDQKSGKIIWRRDRVPFDLMKPGVKQPLICECDNIDGDHYLGWMDSKTSICSFSQDKDNQFLKDHPPPIFSEREEEVEVAHLKAEIRRKSRTDRGEWNIWKSNKIMLETLCDTPKSGIVMTEPEEEEKLETVIVSWVQVELWSCWQKQSKRRLYFVRKVNNIIVIGMALLEAWGTEVGHMFETKLTEPDKTGIDSSFNVITRGKVGDITVFLAGEVDAVKKKADSGVYAFEDLIEIKTGDPQALFDHRKHTVWMQSCMKGIPTIEFGVYKDEKSRIGYFDRCNVEDLQDIEAKNKSLACLEKIYQFLKKNVGKDQSYFLHVAEGSTKVELIPRDPENEDWEEAYNSDLSFDFWFSEESQK